MIMISIYFKWDIGMCPYLINFFDKKLEKLNNLILIYFFLRDIRMGPIESMGQCDWAHLDLLYRIK